MTKYHVSGDGIDIGVFEGDSEEEVWEQAAPECDCDPAEPMPEHVTMTELDYPIDLLKDVEEHWADYEGECDTARSIWGCAPGMVSPDSLWTYTDALLWCFKASNTRDWHAQRYVLRAVDRSTSAWPDDEVLDELEHVQWTT